MRTALLSGEPIKDVKEIGEFSLNVAATLTRSGKGKRIVIQDEGPGVDPALVKLLRESFALRRAIFGGGASSNETSDAWTSTYRARRIALLKLSYLAPEVIRTIFHGQQPPTLSPKRLMAMTKDLPFAWADQPRYLGFTAD